MDKVKPILWLDDDPTYTKAWCRALEKVGYTVTQVYTLSDAKKHLESGINYQLLILDIMIPTMTDEEDSEYPCEKTDEGMKTGLLFYCKYKDHLRHKNIPVLVTSSRTDPTIFQDFLESGLSAEAFETKFALRDPKILVEKVIQLTRNSQ